MKPELTNNRYRRCLARITLRLWHSVWRDYWNERMDDPVCYTDTSGISHAMRKYNYHLNRWHETFPQNK